MVEKPRRATLSRDVVLQAAVSLADDSGIESVSMRNLARELGVVPMALYKHVANKEELLDGMIDVIVEQIEPPTRGNGWKAAIRRRILSARHVVLTHPWASQVIQSRSQATPTVLAYMDSLIGMFREGGFSVDLTHHVMHALGSRMWGFTLDVFPTPTPPEDPDLRSAMFDQFAGSYPHIIEIATAGSHDDATTVGPGCDDQFEFEFGLDILLEGFEQLHERRWTSTHNGRA